MGCDDVICGLSRWAARGPPGILAMTHCVWRTGLAGSAQAGPDAPAIPYKGGDSMPLTAFLVIAIVFYVWLAGMYLIGAIRCRYRPLAAFGVLYLCWAASFVWIPASLIPAVFLVGIGTLLGFRFKYAHKMQQLGIRDYIVWFQRA
jgi:hypothetical protein